MLFAHSSIGHELTGNALGKHIRQGYQKKEGLSEKKIGSAHPPNNECMHYEQ